MGLPQVVATKIPFEQLFPDFSVLNHHVSYYSVMVTNEVQIYRNYLPNHSRKDKYRCHWADALNSTYRINSTTHPFDNRQSLARS